MDQIGELERVFLDVLRDFPELQENLRNDMSFTLENEFVERLVARMTGSSLDEETLQGIENKNLFISKSAQEIENGQDFLLQAILASPSTPSSFLKSTVGRNPTMLTGGWLYIQRLCENPNCPSDLLIKLATIAIEMEEIDICEQLLLHPNLPEPSIEAIEEYLA